MHIDKDKIRRFTSPKFSFNDYLTMSSWFKKEEFQEEFKQHLEYDWNETGDRGNKAGDLSRILDRLHHQINLDQKRVSSTFYQKFSRMAAILLIPAFITIAVLAWFAFPGPDQLVSWAEVHSPVGARTQFQLPDGTKGWLNSGSSIRYPLSFKNRKVEVSGEAWFDVAHLKNRTFTVLTPSFDICVTGTRFNVISYDHEKTAEVILEEGRVVVTGKDKRMKLALSPDDHLIYDKDRKQLTRSSIDSRAYTRWKEGLLIFKNEPMTEIARRLERKYNAEIILHGDSLKSSVFRATFTDESLDEICKMLSMVAPVHYRIHEREKQPDHTFTKNKVEMWLAN